MNILLVDLDSKIPNLALMKLSTYHKAMGHKVTLIRIGFDGYASKKPKVFIDNTNYDKTYLSNIFKVNKDRFLFKANANVLVGGIGSNNIPLKKEIDLLKEDYSIYPNNKSSFGFITRGCPRKCAFCVVPEKEGGIYKYRSIKQIVKHPRAYFLDNNILAYKKHLDVFKELKTLGIRYQFNQGLDIRLITNKNAKALANANYIGEYTFAFDNVNMLKVIERQFAIVKKHIPLDWKCRMFILGGFDSTITDDLIRILWCKENKVKPYFMRHQGCWNNEHVNLYISLAAWCNQPSIFKNMTFPEFMKKRTGNKIRVKNDTKKYLFFEKAI